MDRGMKYSAYTQISPERDVTNDAFTKGQINFRINLDSMSRWNPYKSYMRMRVQMTDGGGNMLNHTSKIAPNMFQGDCFWQQMNMSCNGVRVSSIDDYYIQIAALKKRMVYDQSRRDTMLKETNFAQASLKDRLAQVQEFGFSNGDPGWHSFMNLHQEDGDFILANEDVTIDRDDAASPYTIRYRANGGGGPGSVDLTETDLQIGDYIKICEDTQQEEAFTVRRISYIDVAEITVEGGNNSLNHLPNTSLIFPGSYGCRLYYSKKPASRRVRTYELIFRPCLGFFDIDEFLPGNYQFELTPCSSSSYQDYAVEGLVNLAGAEFKVTVLDLQLYAYTGIASSPMNGIKHYDFSETRCQGQTLTSATLLNKCFVVNKKSHMYTLAFQDAAAGSDIRLSRAKFRVDDDVHLSLRRYQLRCGSYSLPTPLPDIQKDPATNIDLSTQQYYEELMYTKSAYLNDPESLSEWYDRGPYYSYRMPAPAANPSNRLYVSVEFSEFEGNFIILLMDTYYTGFSISLDNGIIKGATRDVTIN